MPLRSPLVAVTTGLLALIAPSPAQELPSLGPLEGLLPSSPKAAPSSTPPIDTATDASGQANTQNLKTQGSEALKTPEGPSFLGMELPFLDPGSEVLSWNGTSWNVINNRMFGARFEKYLNAPPADSDEDQAYRDTLRQILDALSPHQPNKGNLSKAVGLLPIAAAYHHDARLCESLSNTIYGIWLARRNVSALKQANAELERQAKRQLWNANLSASSNPLRNQPRTVPNQNSSRNQNNGSNASSNGNNTNNNNPLNAALGNQGLTGLLGSPSAGSSPNDAALAAQENFDSASWTAYYLKRFSEYETLAAKNKIDMMASEFQQKMEFQGLILQYFMQRRFEHVVIASRLYRLLFTDGNASMQLDESSAVYRSFKAGYGMTPTVTTFDALANEAIRDVDEGVQAFEHLVSKNELESASKRLSESFAVGEYLPRIRTLSLEKKARVLEFVRHSNQLLSALDIKNYHLAKEIVEKMKGLAKDFDYAKAEGLIEATTMTAEMLLNKALLAARSGDEVEMQKNLEQAHALYPTNPELKKVSDLILKGSDTQSQALSDLDRLVAEGNYRAIQNDEARFVAAVGLANDPQRVDTLMTVRKSLKELEMRMEKAKALQGAGNPEAAWETMHLGAEQFGADPEFSQLYNQLTVKAAAFVHMIEQAHQRFEMEQFGSSLSWYLKARQAYLKSDLANEGIEQIVGKMLPTDSALSP